MRRGLCLSIVIIAIVSGRLTAHAASGVVNCAGLQTALNTAQSGDVITLNGTCNQAYTLRAGVAITLRGDSSDGPDGLDGTAITAPLLRGTDVRDTTIRNLIFRDANATGLTDGAAISLTGAVWPTIAGCAFQNNSGGRDGGAVAIASSWAPARSRISIETNIFGTGAEPNATNGSGGALFVDSAIAAVTLADNTFTSNAAASGGGAALYGNIRTLSGNNFVDNSITAGDGGGLELRLSPGKVLITDNVFRGNIAAGPTPHGGGLAMRARFSGPDKVVAVQKDNIFDTNLVNSPGITHGGGEAILAVDVTSTNDRFINNSLNNPGRGGGLEVVGSSFRSSRFVGRNLVAAGNFVENNSRGSGIEISASGDPAASLTLLDSTVAGNISDPGSTSPGVSGGSTNAVLVLKNSIVESNTVSGAPTALDVDPSEFASVTARSSDVCGSSGAVAGPGNICADPALLNPFPGNADVHQTSSSPTRNRGNNTLVPKHLKRDFEGDPRIIGRRVDMGADELA